MTIPLRRVIIRTTLTIAIIAISNIPAVTFAIAVLTGEFGLMYGQKYDYFVSGHGGFSSNKFTWTSHDQLVQRFGEYKKINPSDTTLYRTFKINPLKFWFWREFIFEPYYKYPYKDAPEKEE